MATGRERPDARHQSLAENQKIDQIIISTDGNDSMINGIRVLQCFRRTTQANGTFIATTEVISLAQVQAQCWLPPGGGECFEEIQKQKTHVLLIVMNCMV